MPVVYNAKVPLEFFDFIFIDECHRSIYNLWQQVLDYFDAFPIGLTATPDNSILYYQLVFFILNFKLQTPSLKIPVKLFRPQ